MMEVAMLDTIMMEVAIVVVTHTILCPYLRGNKFDIINMRLGRVWDLALTA